MSEGFFQFNNSIIEQIKDFTISTFDLLFIAGAKGTNKRETVKEALIEFEHDNLIFSHFCFSNTVIDDFLLNLYDELRNFSLAKRISLKKFEGDNFSQKVSHYFKTLGANSIIVVENFEKVEGNIEIIDFLSHLASYINVKIIIISTNPDKNLFRFKKIKMKTINVAQISHDDFNLKLDEVFNNSIDNEQKEKFFEITAGRELYLKMGVKYCSITGVKLAELLNEFDRKEVGFEEFMVSKFVSLTPNNYLELLRTLCALNHPVTKAFLENYQLSNTDYIEYLSKNFLVSFFKDEMYVKDYFKQYITRTFSIAQKTDYYTNLINIYENELTKSPRDRLLRLSRESIRKEIAYLNTLIPNIKAKSGNAFTYMGSSFETERQKPKSKLAQKLEKIKERKKALSQQDQTLLVNKRLADSNKKSLVEENKAKNRLFVIELINEAVKLNKEYHYIESNAQLKRAFDLDDNNEFKIEILVLRAKNYKGLNSLDLAIKSYEEALKYATDTKSSRKCEIELLIAHIYKNMYKIDEAINRFRAIANNSNNKDKHRASALIELGELLEASSKTDEAINSYKKALELSNDDIELTAKCYYKLAVLYDENGDNDLAIKYYKMNYQVSSDKNINKYYSVSLTNLALILIEQSEPTKAIEYFKLALKFDFEKNDLENIYFSQKELAKIYTKIDTIEARNYYEQALNTAKKLNDNFKIALVYFESGEFFYDREDDEHALNNFLKAKAALNNNPKDENVARINLRIKDIKMRLDSKIFNSIINKYDS